MKNVYGYNKFDPIQEETRYAYKKINEITNSRLKIEEKETKKLEENDYLIYWDNQVYMNLSLNWSELIYSSG
ncbi:MAG: hypothetical protein ACFFDB_00620 [Promethearchaeota archaeon]